MENFDLRQLLLSLFLCTLSLSVFGFSQSDLLYLQDFYGFAVQNSKPGDGGSNPEQSSEDENCDQPSNFVEQLYGEDIPKACKEANGK